MLRHLSYNRLLMYEILLLVDNQPIYGFMITQNGEGRTSYQTGSQQCSLKCAV